MKQRQTRMTKQRTVILTKLREVSSHPTADEIYTMTRENLPHISLGTVYRNLEVLSRQGEITCLTHSGFQKRFDGNPLPHYHVRCMQCGRIGDVEAHLPPPDVTGARACGFTLTGMEVMFEGICEYCKK